MNHFGSAGVVTILDSELVRHGGGIFSPDPDSPAVRLVRRVIGGVSYTHAEPVMPEGAPDPCWMFGGTFIFTSDSRMTGIASYPIPLHDRSEARKAPMPWKPQH